MTQYPTHFTTWPQDAFLLATLLGHRLTTLKSVSRALSIYDTIRRPIATEVAERSLINGRLFGLQLPGVPLDNDPQRLPELGDAIRDNWKWSMWLVLSYVAMAHGIWAAWSTTLDGDVKDAVRMLESGEEVRAQL